MTVEQAAIRLAGYTGPFCPDCGGAKISIWFTSLGGVCGRFQEVTYSCEDCHPDPGGHRNYFLRLSIDMSAEEALEAFREPEFYLRGVG